MNVHLTIQPSDPRIRDWPYPFRAGLSIANDAEYLTADCLDELLRYVNSNERSRLGFGLGLQLSSSLFFFSGRSCSVFSGLLKGAVESKWGGRAKELVAAGAIDTNHSFGEFDDAPLFTREHAVRAYDWLQKAGLHLPIFSNHGGTNNRQNVGGDAAYHKGDDVRSSAYHSDLLAENRVNFVWSDSKSYENVSLASCEEEPSAKSDRWARLFGKARTSNVCKASKPTIRLLDRQSLQDGTDVWRFFRYRGTGFNAPNVSSFFHQVSSIFSGDIYSDRGGIIVYQHFGVLSRQAGVCYQATVEHLAGNSAGFLSAWRMLAREFHEGRMWIATLSQYLRYVRAVENLIVDFSDDGSVNLWGRIDGMSEDDLRFITIYVPDGRRYVPHFGGKELPYIANGPDESGQYSISILGIRCGEGLWS